MIYACAPPNDSTANTAKCQYISFIASWFILRDVDCYRIVPMSQQAICHLCPRVSNLHFHQSSSIFNHVHPHFVHQFAWLFFSAGWYPPFVHSRCHIHGKFLHARIFLGRLPASSEALRRWETCRQSMSSGSNCQPGSCFEHCLCSFTVFPNHGNLAPISEQICEKNKKQPRRFYKQMGRSKVTVINLNNKF